MKEDIRTKEGYRLAPLLLRISAVFIDLVFYVLTIVLLYFFMFPHGYFPTVADALGMNEKWETMEVYQRASGLVRLSDDGEVILGNIEGDSYEPFQEAVEYYYFTYNGAENEVNPDPQYETYTIEWYNHNVLLLPTGPEYENTSPLFTFAKDENGVATVDQLGVFKDDLYEVDDDGNFVYDENNQRILTYEAQQEIRFFYIDEYQKCQNLLLNAPYYHDLQTAYSGDFFIISCLTLYPGYLVFYLIIPLFSSYGMSLGKRFLGLALIRYDGTSLPRYCLALRVIPYVLTLFLILLFNDMTVGMTIGIVVFLTSSGTGLLSKKRRALHDYVAMSVVTRREDAEASVYNDVGPMEREHA